MDKILSKWIDLEDCSVRVFKNTDPLVVDNRIALIEQTPRVRVETHNKIVINGETYEPSQSSRGTYWVYGDKGRGMNTPNTNPVGTGAMPFWLV